MISARDIATVNGEPILVTAIIEPHEREVVVGLAAELPEETAAPIREAARMTLERAIETAERMGFPYVDKLREQMDEHPLLGEHIYLGVGDAPVLFCLT